MKWILLLALLITPLAAKTPSKQCDAKQFNVMSSNLELRKQIEFELLTMTDELNQLHDERVRKIIHQHIVKVQDLEDTIKTINDDAEKQARTIK